MKRVLILGAGSFVGGAFEAYLKEKREGFCVATVDMRSPSWQKQSFAGFDTAVHVAGIAHRSSKGLDAVETDEYWRVNALLPFEAAQKAKAEGIKQFIFLSSMSVYGQEGRIGQIAVIGDTTPLAPDTLYGKSKLEAENRLKTLEDEGFRLVVLRPPMIYGPRCKGNYPLLSKAARMLPFFPDLGNRRSMLYIGTLCRVLHSLAESGAGGLFFPRNREDVEVSQLVHLIASAHGHHIKLTRLFNGLIRLPGGRIAAFNKVFGSLIYDAALPTGLSGDEEAFEDTVRITEGALR